MNRVVTDKETQPENSVAGAAKSVGSNIARAADSAVEFVMEKTGIRTETDETDVAGITEHMDVIASCGKKIGVVDGVESGALKLTRKDSPDDQHHFIPLNWIARVDEQVHLNRNSKESIAGWKSSAASCGCDTK